MSRDVFWKPVELGDRDYVMVIHRVCQKAAWHIQQDDYTSKLDRFDATSVVTRLRPSKMPLKP